MNSFLALMLFALSSSISFSKTPEFVGEDVTCFDSQGKEIECKEKEKVHYSVPNSDLQLAAQSIYDQGALLRDDFTFALLLGGQTTGTGGNTNYMNPTIGLRVSKKQFDLDLTANRYEQGLGGEVKVGYFAFPAKRLGGNGIKFVAGIGQRKTFYWMDRPEQYVRVGGEVVMLKNRKVELSAGIGYEELLNIPSEYTNREGTTLPTNPDWTKGVNLNVTLGINIFQKN